MGVVVVLQTTDTERKRQQREMEFLYLLSFHKVAPILESLRDLKTYLCRFSDSYHHVDLSI